MGDRGPACRRAHRRARLARRRAGWFAVVRRHGARARHAAARERAPPGVPRHPDGAKPRLLRARHPEVRDPFVPGTAAVGCARRRLRAQPEPAVPEPSPARAHTCAPIEVEHRRHAARGAAGRPDPVSRALGLRTTRRPVERAPQPCARNRCADRLHRVRPHPGHGGPPRAGLPERALPSHSQPCAVRRRPAPRPVRQDAGRRGRAPGRGPGPDRRGRGGRVGLLPPARRR